MVSSSKCGDARSASSLRRLLVPVLVIGLFIQEARAVSLEVPPRISEDDLLQKWGQYTVRNLRRKEPEDPERPVPLVITNKCDSTIWPGIATQSGKGPGVGGFELAQGKSKELWVGSEWQGRVWGRTNCTVKGDSCSCKTGDCFGKLDCEFSVSGLPSVFHIQY